MVPRPDALADDVRLMEAVKAGDASALAVLWDRHSPVVLGLCRRILRDLREAEEAALDAFIQAWEQGDRYDAARASPLTWLLMMARSRALDRARAAGRSPHLAVAPDDDRLLGALEGSGASAHQPVDALLGEERKLRVRAALAELPALQREAVELAFLDGLTHREIAERLGAPLGTVKTRIRQGLLRLRDHLQAAGGKP